MTLATAPSPGPSRPRTPLWPVLAFVFLNSLGTGVVVMGVYFIAEEQYHVSLAMNFGLGAAFGVVYVPSALAVGPAVRALIRRRPEVTTRRVLGVLMACCAAACLLPFLVREVWALWLLMPLYGVLNGVLWPLTEAYVSGGRRGEALRAAVGRFNISWAGAIFVAMWAAAPLLAIAPLWVLGVQALVHLATIPLLLRFTADPAAHSDRVAGDHPPVYERLLSVFRLQLPTSFVVISALEPFLPFALTRLDVDTGWKLPIVSVWMGTRVVTFLVMERWHGWHGQWGTTLSGGGLMLGGFAVAVLAPELAGGAAGIGLMLVGLATTGVGAGVIYAAALYYALEVGAEEVDAGGTHEALIGLGYTSGPVCGLLAAGVVGLGVLPGGAVEPIMLVLVWAVCLSVGIYALGRARRGRAESLGSGVGPKAKTQAGSAQ